MRKENLLLVPVHAGMAVSVFASCTSPQSAIEAENCQLGSPFSEWYIVGAGSPNIQGFATDISVNAGQPVFVKISTSTLMYNINIYRHALADTSAAPNGVFAYGSTSVFPGNTHQSANYWVDVVFNASPQ